MRAFLTAVIAGALAAGPAVGAPDGALASRVAIAAGDVIATGDSIAAGDTVAPPAPCPASAATLAAQGGILCVLFDDAVPDAQRAVLRDWTLRSAQIVAGYYGRFPAARVLLKIRSMPGSGVGGGRTTNDSQLEIQVRVGRESTASELASDWVLVHEMVHLALPELGRSHNWLAEGLATYVEGIARAQFGNRPIRDVWSEYRRSMPRGLPQPGEGGMDQTPTWGRTYWGGALFCLQSDISMRERTGNRIGLQWALRAILNQTGGYRAERSIDDVLRIGDSATGTRVLEDLYRETKSTAVTPDLEQLWRRLGVPGEPNTQPFDDQAPLAAVRMAITRPAGT
jgi:hypothetical protein